MLGEVGDQTRSEDALPIVRSIQAAIQIERGPAEAQPDLFRHFFQRLEALRPPHHVCLIDGSSHSAMMVDEGNDLRALLVFVPREAHALAPVLATGLVPSSWSTRRSSCCSTARCRTLPTNACHSDPAPAHLAKTL